MREHIELALAIVTVCCAAERSGKQREGALCTEGRICYRVRPGFCSPAPGQQYITPLNAAFT